MKRLIVVLLLLLSIPLAASHIVGGEIELLHVSGSTYRVNLIYYFDYAHNSSRNIQAEEPTIDMYIFRKSDNKQIRMVRGFWLRKTRVGYTQPSCSQGEIITDKIIYTTTIELTAEYSDPMGYYITWARCCRNYSILNIISQDPDHGGQGAGQTFYLEFPPVRVNGQPFINSSPKDFPALNDYACPTKPYYADFAGIDDDGDSLAYTIVTPLTTSSVVPVPPPSPGPYNGVDWLPGFGLDRVINGTPSSSQFPDLRINRDGLLRVTPKSQGLYVFAVKIEEYRNKIKIGEVRRDFQMLVTDCRVSAPPEIVGKKIDGGSFVAENLSVQYNNTVSDNDRCIVVSISDPDANRAQDNFQEVIKLKVVALNFKSKTLSSVLPAETSKIISGTGTVEFTICFPQCPFLYPGSYQIGVIAFDDACALPLSDTLKVSVGVEPPHNERAKFIPPDIVTASLNEGDQGTWDFEARDAEGDKLLFSALTTGFSMNASGMKAIVDSNVDGDGLLKGHVAWDAFCDIYDFTQRTDFILRLLVDDDDVCKLNDPDTATFNLKVILPTDNKPIVDTDLTANAEELEIDGGEKRIFDNWSFTVTGKDLDNDKVTVQMLGDGFSPSLYGMSMPQRTGVGSTSSVFNWDLVCDKFNLDERDEFNIGFIAIDSTNKCRIRQVDTLVVKVKVLKPLNAVPKVSITNLDGGAEYSNGNALVMVGQTMNLQIDVSDGDVPKDNLSLLLVDIGGDKIPTGWTFEDKNGVSVLSSNFTWTPQCSIFEGEVFEHDFYFDFRFADNHCLTAVTDTVRVNVKVKDVESGAFDRLPSNVFTPNGDNYNDYYSMEARDESGDLINILPPDNCRGVFETIKIYNRWGKTVFTSSDRNFRWYGLEESAGVYFYHVIFSNREFKGTVSLRD